MEVTGAPKSIYFDAETLVKAEQLMTASGKNLSELVRDLIRKEHAELKPAGKSDGRKTAVK